MNKINEIDGMFAIAWLNIKEKKMHLLRDRTGVKTLYYYHKNNNFYFCSEAWFLYSQLEIKKIDFDALNFYLRFGFNHSYKCIPKNIFKVQPGEIITYDMQSNNFKITSFLKNENFFRKGDYNSLDKNLSNAVKLNLISDVKTGVFLSGGIDSSLITILSKKLKPEIETFTNKFDHNLFYKHNHDLKFAKKLCKEFNIKLNLNLIEANQISRDNLMEALNFFDEPLANLNILNSFLQARLARKMGVKVILTGDGADEIFGGYQKYVNTKIAAKFKFFSPFSKKIRLYQNYNADSFPLLFFEKLNDEDIKKFFKPEFSYEILKSKSHFLSYKNLSKNYISNIFDFKNWLTNDHNYKLDRTLMANSIEGRVPFQSNNIIDNYFYSDLNSKISFFKTKVKLRKNNILPSYINNRTKQGWHLPEKWFVQNILKESFFDLVNQANFVKKSQVLDLYNKKKYPKTPIYKIVTIYVLMFWNKKINYF